MKSDHTLAKPNEMGDIVVKLPLPPGTYPTLLNPKQTKFLSKGKKNNSYTKNGLEMLETQAKISWDIWNK